MSRPLLVELVGPAGAGKTTLLRAITQRDKTIRGGLRIHRIRDLGLIIRSTVSLAPTFVSLLLESPLFLWRNLRHLVRLETLYPVVRRQPSSQHRAVIMDEGPVFTLARLTALDDVGRDSRAFELCRGRAMDKWARTLDAVVWLDAPDSVLAHRIRGRAKAHRVKNESDRTISEFLGRYRSSYGAVISGLAGNGASKVIAFDTASESTDQIADRVIAALAGRETTGAGT